MKSLARKGTALMLSILMLITLGACGGTDSEDTLSGTVYVPEFIDFDLSALGIENINNGCCDGENIYILAEVMREIEQTDPETGDTYTDYEYTSSIFQMPIDGGEVRELENYTPSQAAEDAVDRESYFYIDGISIGAEGSLWVTENLEEYIYDVPEDFDPETDYIWNYEMLEYTSTQLRRRLDVDGTEIERIDTSGLSDAVGLSGTDGYVNSVVMDSDGTFYVYAEFYTDGSYETKIIVLDQEMNRLYEIKCGDSYGELILLGNGVVAVNGYEYNSLTGEGGQVLRTIDPQTHDWGAEYSMPLNANNVYPGGGKYLFYYDNGDSLYGFLAKSETGEKILSWSNADINRSDLQFFTLLEDGRIAAMTRRWGDDGMEAELVLLTEQDASVLENKTVLTYATMYLSYSARERIIEFNKTHTDCRIEIRDYSEFNTQDDYTAGLTKLNTEIVAGKVPDILDTSGLPIHQYGGKGLLEDLWQYIEQDEELGGRDGVMQEVLQAAELDGKLYQLFGSFTIRTVAGASEIVGDRLTWTLEDMDTALAQMGEDCALFGEGDTRENMLSNVMAMQMDSFVDFSSGECRFDSEEFITLLEFCNRFPLEFDWNQVDWDEYEDEMTRVTEGRQMLYAGTLYDFEYLQVYQFMFGGDVSYIGYPREDGGVGSSFVIEDGLAMSAACKDKEAAWSFIRELILPESDPEDEYFYFGWGFPVNRQDFDKLAEVAMTPYYVLDENGEPMLDEDGNPIEESQGGMGWGNGIMVELYATTQEQYDQFMELYHTIDSVYTYDEEIYEIVHEVALRYFNDALTVQEAADQIQSRVKIYVNENL